MYALPAAASAIAAAAPAAVAKVSLMATLKTVAFNALTNLAISTAMSALQPQVGLAGRTFDFVIDPDGPIPFAAGLVGVAGSVVHRDTFGPDLMYYGIPAVLSGAGPIDGYESFKADDEAVTFDGNGKAITSQYANELWFKTTLGTQPDTALASPSGLKGGATLPGWGSSHKLSGKAAFMIVMGENSKQSAFPTGEIKPLITFRGLKLWDPRLDSTYPGGSGSCRLDTPSTWVYSTNPILWALKWSLGLWEGPTGKGAPQVDYQVGGIGAKLSGIDVAAFVSGANVADANDWTVSAYPNTDDDKHQVLNAFLQAGGCIYAQRAGKISCIQRAAPRSSIVTISAADTAGPLEIDTAASRIDRINTIRPRFWSPDHRWQLTAMPEVSVSAYVTEDGAKRTRGIDFPFVSNSTQAGQLAALQIANTREGIAGVIPLKPHLQRIRPGDAFTITEAGFVLDGLKCLCLNTDYDPGTGVVRVSFVAETDGKYAYALGLSPTPPEAQVLTPEDRTVSPPQPGEWSLSAATFSNGGVSVPALLFTGLVDNARTQAVLFEFRPVGAADWSGAGVEDQTVTRKEAAGGLLTPGVYYEGAVSYRVAGNVSDRLVLGPVLAGSLIAGDTAPITPANVAGTPTLSISTTIAPDGSQISRMTGDFADAADAISYVAEIDNGTVVQQVPLTESAIKDRIVTTGPSYQYRVKGLSRTGTLSAAWSSWSASVAAGGDTTAPGPISAPYIQGGIGQIAMRWTNPTDDDFQRVLIFRSTNPAVPGDPYAWSLGTNFIDDSAVVGTTYHYWGLTQDRTGNVNGAELTYIGSAVARLTRFFDDVTERPIGFAPDKFDGLGYLKPTGIRRDNVALEDRWAEEGGANKTETRMAASIEGQTDWAIYTGRSVDALNNAIDTSGYLQSGLNSQIRPNVLMDGLVGTQLSHDPEFHRSDTVGAFYTVYDNSSGGKTTIAREYNSTAPNGSSHQLKITYDGTGTPNSNPTPGFGGIYQGLSYANGASRPGCYTKGTRIIYKVIAIVPVGRSLVFTNNSYGDDGTQGWLSANQGAGTGGWETYLYYYNIGYSGTFSTIGHAYISGGPNTAFSWWLAKYEQVDVTSATGQFPANLRKGANGAALSDASLITGEGTAAALLGQGYFATQDFADWATRITGAGKPSDNAGTSLVLTPYDGNTTVTGNYVHRTGAPGSWNSGATSQAITGPCHASARLNLTSALAGHTLMLGLADSFDGVYTSIDFAWYFPGDGTAGIYESGGNYGVHATGVTREDVWAVTYDNGRVHYTRNGNILRTVVTTVGRRFFFATSIVYGGLRDIQFGPAQETPRIDGILNTARTGEYGAAELVTASGVAASYAGQPLHATQSFPYHAGNAAAVSAGLGAGKFFYDTTNSNLLTAVYVSGVAGGGAKQLTGAAGSLGATSAAIASVSAGAYVQMDAQFDVPLLNADAPMYGYIRFEEGSGGTWTTLGDVSAQIDSSSESVGGGWATMAPANASIRKFGTRSGSVTYRATFIRTSGSDTHGSGFQMSGAVVVTAPG